MRFLKLLSIAALCAATGARWRSLSRRFLALSARMADFTGGHAERRHPGIPLPSQSRCAAGPLGEPDRPFGFLDHGVELLFQLRHALLSPRGLVDISLRLPIPWAPFSQVSLDTPRPDKLGAIRLRKPSAAPSEAHRLEVGYFPIPILKHTAHHPHA